MSSIPRTMALGTAITLTIVAPPVCAATPAPAAPAKSQSDSANQMLTEQFGPFKLSFGQDSGSGGFGANLDGQGRKALESLGLGPETPGVKRAWFPSFSYLGYAATGSWGSTQGATNNASLSLKPGIDGAFAYGEFYDPFNDPSVAKPVTCAGNGCTDANGKRVPLATVPTFYFGAGASGDLELRYGTFKHNGSNVSARELLVGADLYAVALRRDWSFGFGRVLAAPRLAVSYYHPTTVAGTEDVALPTGVKADYIQSEFETVIGFGGSSTSTVKLDLKYDGSQPTTGVQKTWQNLWSAKLWIPGLKFNGVNPTLTYQSGKNGGFTYDRQVLLGVLVEFLDPGSK